MKQYYTGFFTAVCLTTSLFLFIGSQNSQEIEARSLILKGVSGTTSIIGGNISMYNNEGKQTAYLGTTNDGSSWLVLYNDGTKYSNL